MPCCSGCWPAKSPPKPKSAREPKVTAPLIPKEERSHGISTSQFIADNPGKKILDVYSMDKKAIGEGSYGSVCKGVNKSTQAVRAIKTIPKPSKQSSADRFKLEIQIMKMMDHPNIIKLYESFEDHRNVYLVMELCTGGELFDRIIELGRFTEGQAAVTMQQILKPIYYMHENHVCHRDLKPENFFFLNKDPIEKNELKLIDFGLSCKFDGDKLMTTKAGTPYYVAPQVLAGKYDHMSDMWSVGVIMYVMLCGYPPFYGDTDAQILSKVRLGNFTFNPKDWQNVSDDAKNLIRLLLKMSPKDRYTAVQALNHVWIKNKAPKAAAAALTDAFVDKLRGFRSQSKLKKAALLVIAGQMSDEEIKALRKAFHALDANGDGLLTAAELSEGLKKSGLKDLPVDLQQIFNDIDSNASGVIDYTEFLAATLDRRAYLRQDVCWSAFRVFDKNGDGKISPEELRCVLENDEVQSMAGLATIAQIMKDLDSNGDGFIDFQEFMKMMHDAGS